MSNTLKNKKKYVIDCGEHFKTEYGILNKKKPDVVYITGKAKVQPLEKKNTYASDIKDVKNAFESFLPSVVNNSTFKEKYLYSFDVTENSMSYHKKSNIKYTLLLVPKTIRETNEYMDEMVRIGTEISSKLNELMDNGGFEIS